ncbi:Uncharacterised protein [[Clostridium] sordellii]|uniref:hypothetical protein n=1 Tax=Paraclostridium sordellii TaxID=1505 RepID=UPI0005E9D47B|nr:hypothetical protein [Paeniclostridium sordellii]CEN25481.1 Uncharacterised protein [[Clostridium] sordellii] [Paeniclostridium sordellii]
MKIYTDILVRDVPENTDLILKSKAKKSNLSRNEYIVNLLNTHVMIDEIEQVKNSYEEILKHTLVALKENTEVMQQIIEMIEG